MLSYATQQMMSGLRTLWNSAHVLFRRSWNSVRGRAMLAMVFALALFVMTDLIFPFRPSIHYSQIVVASDGTVVQGFLSDDDKWRMKIELSEMSPLLRAAIIEKEDRWFYWHLGLNPFAILRAGWKNVSHGRTMSGASTITMQVARLLEPKPRTVLNKLRESIRAIQLELHYSKDEILQMYVNLIPYGGNVEGVKAASLLYFDCLPQNLSLAQVVTLAVIPNKPTTLRMGEQNLEISRQRDRWLKRFAEQRVFSREAVEDAMREPSIMRRVDVPHVAPHYSLRMRSLYPSTPILHTTLNARAQYQAAMLSFRYIQRTKMLGIYNCSVLVVNNQTRNVEAYIGSADFGDVAHAGQCDGVQSLRSPGSALKPLLYAQAMDAGLITPKTVVTDVPINFDGYAPENYDQTYHGAVSVEEALAQSLNVPAVNILHQIGVQPFAQKLATVGFKSVKRNAANVGLSLALGGCGVRLDEMAQLYSAFACGGELRPLHWLESDTDSKSQRIISASSAYMITEILTKLTRPDLPVNSLSATHIPKIAWKTGTSYGRRDAWSIGYNKRYTIAVWVGNFSGEGVADLTGATSATPLLFELFNSLDDNSTSEWYNPPRELDFRIVCAESGRPPSEYCDKTVTDYYIPTVSPVQQCTHLKEVCVSHDQKMSYCTQCLPQSGYKRVIYRNYQPELLSYNLNERIRVALPPRHNPLCTRVLKEDNPRIDSPVHDKAYIVNRDDKEPMLLSCTVTSEVKSVFWYVNDRLIKEARPQDQVFFKPERGRNKISCCDDKGRNRNIFVTVDWE